MKEWLTPNELAGLPEMPKSDRAVRLRAQRQGWTTRKRQRGKGYEYHISSLPPKTRRHLAFRRLSSGLKAIKGWFAS